MTQNNNPEEKMTKADFVRLIEDMWVDLEGYSPMQIEEIENYICKKLGVYQ